MTDKRVPIEMTMEPVTLERVKLWMATHRVACREDAIHRLLNYALDSAGIERRPDSASAA
jgi:hypothetical protein